MSVSYLLNPNLSNFHPMTPKIMNLMSSQLLVPIIPTTSSAFPSFLFNVLLCKTTCCNYLDFDGHSS